MPRGHEFPNPEVQVLEGLEAVRRRPAMYVGPLDAPDLPNRLLQETLCLALDSGCDGACTSLTIILDKIPGSFTVIDNGPGWSLEPLKCGTPFAEAIMTMLFACRAAKEERQKQLCGDSIAVTNALSAHAEVTIVRKSSDPLEYCERWRQSYIRGARMAPFKRLEGVIRPWERGTSLSFQLDTGILPKVDFDIHALVNWLLGNLPSGLVTTIHDQRGGPSLPIVITPASPSP